MANRSLMVIGVSGDGDSASIGIGQFCHLARRNTPMIYIIENNGVYGLTKGQFSATADPGSKLKGGEVNMFENIDCAALGIMLGASFVARSFSGDPKQAVPLLKAAIAHKGLALLDIISPCVTFNNHEGSTRSYPNVRKIDSPVHELDFVAFYETPTVEYDPGQTKEVEMPDGSKVMLKKLAKDYDPTDRMAALQAIEQSRKSGQLLTGLLYVDTAKRDFCEVEGMTETPLNELGQDKLRPSRERFTEILKQFA